MTRSRNAILVPVWAILVAAAILAAIVLRADPVLAPGNVALQQVRFAAPGPAQVPASNPTSNAASQRTISVSQQVAPVKPAVSTQPVAPEAPQASGPTQCPPHPGSGLPCQAP